MVIGAFRSYPVLNDADAPNLQKIISSKLIPMPRKQLDCLLISSTKLSYHLHLEVLLPYDISNILLFA